MVLLRSGRPVRLECLLYVSHPNERAKAVSKLLREGGPTEN